MVKTVLITGGSKGIGKASVKKFYDEGYNVAFSSRNQELLDKVEEELSLEKERTLSFKADVTKSEEVKDFVNNTKNKFGSIDVLLCNAGAGFFGNVDEIEEEDFQRNLDVNVTGVFLTCKYALPYLKEQNKGQIVIVSSMAGKTGIAGGSGYCAAKWGVLGFAQSLKQELRETQIKLASILPGSVETNFFDDLPVGPTPNRHLTAEEVAEQIYKVAEQGKTSDIDEVTLRPAYNP